MQYLIKACERMMGRLVKGCPLTKPLGMPTGHVARASP